MDGRCLMSSASFGSATHVAARERHCSQRKGSGAPCGKKILGFRVVSTSIQASGSSSANPGMLQCLCTIGTDVARQADSNFYFHQNLLLYVLGSVLNLVVFVNYVVTLAKHSRNAGEKPTVRKYFNFRLERGISHVAYALECLWSATVEINAIWTAVKNSWPLRRILRK